MTAETASAPTLDLKAAEFTGLALTPGQLAWRRFRKHRLALIGSGGIIVLILFIIIGSILVPESAANLGDLYNRLIGPTVSHIFGTDSTGRDVFNDIIYGGQISIFIGILAVALELLLGTVIGGVAAYFGGWVDAVLMRFTEAMLAIPSLFLLIVLAKFLGKDVPTFQFLGRTFSGSVGIVILVIGLTSWMYLARIVRANVLSLKELDYISAAKALGASSPRIFFNHLVPNTLGPIIVCGHSGPGQCHSDRSLCFLPGVGSPAAHRHLGQHDGSGTILHPARCVVDVGLPQPVHHLHHLVH